MKVSPKTKMPSTLLFSLFLLLASAQARLVARLVEQIEKRVTYNGGWALGLPGTTCPSDAPVACDTGYGSINPTCCPSGQTCFGGIYPHCCPGTTDCQNVVSNLPVCANSTWNMYALGPDNTYFCCEPGQFGVMPLSGYSGICEPLDQVVASSLIATEKSQAGGTAIVTNTATGGAVGGGGGAAMTTSTGLSTIVVTSTQAGGGVTTVTKVSTATATSTSSSSSAGSGSGSSAITKAKRKLSTGAIVGIAVGAFALIAAAFILLRRYLGGGNSKPSGGDDGYQPPGNQSQAPPYVSSQQPMSSPNYAPVGNEYKVPVTAVSPLSSGVGGYGTPTPPPGGGGYGPPPPQQQQYGQGGGYGGGVQPQWEGRSELGVGRGVQ